MKYSHIIKSKGEVAGVCATVIAAFAILSVSFIRITIPKYGYAYSPMVLSEKIEKENLVIVDYELAYPGKVNPDNPLWYAKAARDRVWYAFTLDSNKKADLNLLFSDKRLNSSISLFKNNKPDLGLITLTKAEKYLEASQKKMSESDDGLNDQQNMIYKKIALSSLKHRQVIEEDILSITPEDLRPQVIKSLDYSKEVYKKVREKMISKGLVPPATPFETN